MACQNCDMDSSKSQHKDNLRKYVNKGISEAIKSGSYDDFKTLMGTKKKMFNKLVSRQRGIEWLFQACKYDHCSIVEELLKAGVNPDKQTQKYQYALCEVKSAAVAEMLLQYGASVNGPDDHCNPLYTAVNLCNKEVADVLVKHGAQIDTSVIVAVFNKHYKKNKNAREQMKSQFLNYEFDPNQCTASGDSLLSLLIRCSTIEDLEAVIDKKGANVNFYSMQSRAPIIVALQRNDLSVIRLLFDRGLSLEGEIGMKAIIEASYGDNKSNLLRLLLDKYKKFDFDIVESHKALLRILQIRDYDVFALLVNFGFDVNAEINGMTFLSFIFHQESLPFQNNDSECLQFLLSSGARLSSRDQALALHRCIIVAPMLLKILMVNGGFSPVLFKAGEHPILVEIYRKISWQLSGTHHLNESETLSLQGILSPLCTALICGKISLAKKMLKTFYVTNSDLTLLPRDEIFRQLLQVPQNLRSRRSRSRREKNTKIIDFLDSMSTTVFSLFQLSFSVVSDHLGQQPFRNNSVKDLGVPPYIERLLMFSDDSQHDTADYENEVDDYELGFDGNYSISPPSEEHYDRFLEGLSMTPGPPAVLFSAYARFSFLFEALYEK